MLIAAIDELVRPASAAANGFSTFLDFIGQPTIALLIAVVVAIFLLGFGSSLKWKGANETLGKGLPAVASIILVVCAGGGLKGILVDSGIGQLIARFVTGHAGAPLAVLALAWLVAVIVRVATGSATVSITTTAGIISAIVVLPTATTAGNATTLMVALVILAIGSGSLFLSHVNDAGFWLVKEYFGISVGQTFKTWSLMECVLSAVSFVIILIVAAVILAVNPALLPTLAPIAA
jgi:GntP family gluconate:H+ symporter